MNQAKLFLLSLLGVALAIEYDRTGVFTFLVPAVVGIFVLLASWVRNILDHSKVWSPQIYSLWDDVIYEYPLTTFLILLSCCPYYSEFNKTRNSGFLRHPSYSKELVLWFLEVPKNSQEFKGTPSNTMC